ncbi:hypothetical protein HDE_04514 [Halotydeus destructor]|nr:hypothetical protein HDE_04514 [Halotydeus destructor]
MAEVPEELRRVGYGREVEDKNCPSCPAGTYCPHPAKPIQTLGVAKANGKGSEGQADHHEDKKEDTEDKTSEPCSLPADYYFRRKDAPGPLPDYWRERQEYHRARTGQ